MYYGVYLPIFLPFLAISILGLLNLFILNQTLFYYQLVFFCVAVVMYLLSAFFPFYLYKKLASVLYILNILLLLLVFVLGEITRGSTRWISLGNVNIQPSEFIKLTLILILAYLFSTKVTKYISIKNIISGLLVFVPAFLLVFLQPDLGTSLVLVAIFTVLTFYSGVKIKYIFIIFLLLSISSGPIWSNLKDYQKDRVISFINPSLDPLGAGYNAIQAQIAIGSGGLKGKGLGEGTQSRLGFLPENNTDFAFAAYSEEWGTFGSLLLIIFYFIIIFSQLLLLKSTKNYFSKYVILGVTVVFFVHIFVNIGMNLGLVPVTGIPLPFFSYGGSAFLALSIMLGVVNSVAKSNDLI